VVASCPCQCLHPSEPWQRVGLADTDERPLSPPIPISQPSGMISRFPFRPPIVLAAAARLRGCLVPYRPRVAQPARPMRSSGPSHVNKLNLAITVPKTIRQRNQSHICARYPCSARRPAKKPSWPGPRWQVLLVFLGFTFSLLLVLVLDRRTPRRSWRCCSCSRHGRFGVVQEQTEAVATLLNGNNGIGNGKSPLLLPLAVRPCSRACEITCKRVAAGPNRQATASHGQPASSDYLRRSS
jgi:hypothetical protein